MIVAGDQRIVEIGGDDVETEAPDSWCSSNIS
jgi:hypothetical protein